MGFRYAQVNDEGFIISDSMLSDVVVKTKMIPVSETFDLTNKRFIDGDWVECEPVEEEQKKNEMETAILETALNLEYLVEMMGMNYKKSNGIHSEVNAE